VATVSSPKVVRIRYTWYSGWFTV